MYGIQYTSTYSIVLSDLDRFSWTTVYALRIIFSVLSTPTNFLSSFSGVIPGVVAASVSLVMLAITAIDPAQSTHLEGIADR